MSGKTTVIYNGVKLRRVHTRIFDQSQVRDESDTDIVHQHFHIAVESLINYDAFQADNEHSLGLHSGNFAPVANNPAGILVKARKLLGEDRGNFLMTMDGTTVLQVNGAHLPEGTTSQHDVDVNNGPKVAHVKLTHVSATTFRLSFAIDIALVDCVPYVQAGAVLNNRWSSVDEIDEFEKTTRTWAGRLRVKNVTFNPHFFRGIIVPPLQKGWKRKRMHFQADKNGLELAYSIVDEEMIGDAPPSPAFKMSITHSEGMSIGGAKGSGELLVRLEGGRSSNRIALMNRAFQITFAKLQIFNLTAGTLLMQMMVTEFSGNDVKAIEVRAQLQRAFAGSTGSGGDLASSVGTISLATMGVSLGQLGLADYDARRARIVRPYPATLAGLFICYLQTPCIDLHGIIQPTDSGSQSGSEDTGDEETEVTQDPDGDLPPVGSPDNDPSHAELMYTFARIESIYHMEGNRLALPVAVPGNSGRLAVVDLAPRTAKRRIKYAAERIGAWPLMWIPRDFTDSQGHVNRLLRFTPNLRAPEQTSTGQIQYAVSAEYLFAMETPPSDNDSGLPVGSLPWDTLSSADNLVGGDVFVDPGGQDGIG